jgi:radial spoke head protein 9
MSDISEEEEIKIPPKDLTELDRLAYVVFAIENDCMLAPVGAFKMTPTHQVRRNEAFKGLRGDQATSLQNYLHFRNVQSL